MKLTRGFKGTLRVKQGWCLSPTLFKIYLEQALREWIRKCRKMRLLLDNQILYTLCFTNHEVSGYQEWGLEINRQN